ncbi:NO-associated protein 1, chloroplastic/mitochondrial [Apostasia shenzhenica]|uniref:NO-associated protein 1, chloroplastic/mitochondrial n=1 Tax=Apostasia shenzhenica TaxID=1088818 RepID=A0A2I0AYP5_9ASPA|nr:NO-associated protein 1, chloroplastic/mitochondrial [Apostasia shenzhenica]
MALKPLLPSSSSRELFPVFFLPSPESLVFLPFKKAPVFSPLPFVCQAYLSQPEAPVPSALSAAVPEGTGAGAPTRGEVFIEHHQARAAAALLLNQSGAKEKRKKRRSKAVSFSPVACCYGCGAPLQMEETEAPGYVDPATFKLKKRHHQLRTILCGRCKMLSHGHMVTAVGGHGGYPGGKQFISAEELREKLSDILHEKVDIVDFNGSFLARIRDLAGANPIILVVTKVDLLPKGTDINCLGDWVVEATMKKKLNVVSVHLTSSKSLVGVAGVISEIQKEKKGSANVGKSAFISALLKTMAKTDPIAAAAQKYQPMQSAVPGTTLGPIELEAFQGGGKLFDTPGVHLHHRQAAVVHSEDLFSLAPQSRLRGQSVSVSSYKIDPTDAGTCSLNGFSIFWGGLVRVDAIKKELGLSLTPPNKRRETWPGLRSMRELKIQFEDRSRPACDIAISGLGWIAVEPFGRDAVQNERMDCRGELQLNVHVPKPVELFIRPPMPVGTAGAEWYQYQELTEKEEELRPKWYY